MPKKITATSDDQDQLIESIKNILFGDKNWCILHEIDQKPEKQQEVLDLIPELRKSFLIHNLAGVQRPDSLKRPWLSIMRTFLRRKYHVLSENYLMKHSDTGDIIATKRYILLPKEAIL
jgi:hypothetical protein